MAGFSWIYDGVDPSIAGNGGPDCAAYLPAGRRLWESLLICGLGAAYGWWGWRRATAPQHHHFASPLLSQDATTWSGGGGGRSAEGPGVAMGKKLFLMIMCLVLGCEIGFKCATKTLIYMLNPCHLVTIVQIYLLVAPPSRLVTILFRWQMHSLNGAVLAIIFPVVNTRLLPFEAELYYVQHTMMLIVPFYLLKAGGVYSMERLGDFSWPILTCGSWLLYHFFPLQVIGLLTHVNLNNMLCPAISDPFCGPNYRVWATGHQSLVIGLLGKLYYVLTCVVLWLFGSGLGHCSGAVTSEPWRNGGGDGSRTHRPCACRLEASSNGSAIAVQNGGIDHGSVPNHLHYGNGDVPKIGGECRNGVKLD